LSVEAQAGLRALALASQAKTVQGLKTAHTIYIETTTAAIGIAGKAAGFLTE